MTPTCRCWWCDLSMTCRIRATSSAERRRTPTIEEMMGTVDEGGSLYCCELLDLRTRAVIQENPAIASLSDYILSNNIISRVCCKSMASSLSLRCHPVVLIQHC